MSEIRKCPFCGSDKIRLGRIDRGVGGMGAMPPSTSCVCDGCQARGPLAGYADDYREFNRETGEWDDKAYEAWLGALAWKRWDARKS